MNRASPSDLRKSLEAAHALVKAGIMFVPMPVLNQKDHDELANQMHDRLDTMTAEAEKEEQL